MDTVYDGFEFEAKSKEDNSWHPCRVSFRSGSISGAYLTLEFKSFHPTDSILSEKEALARLRLLSVPLQNGNCLHIDEGMHIVALHKGQSKNLFFDAKVEKVWRVKHSPRIFCRCIFYIRWLNCNLNKETVKVPSNAIRKLQEKSIQTHPSIIAFFKSMDPSNISGITSSGTLLEDMKPENNLYYMLDKQIEEISKLFDEPMKAYLGEISSGFGIGLTKSSKERRALSHSNVIVMHDYGPDYRKSITRSTRNRKETILDLLSDQATPLMNYQKRRTCLNPLASQAALASLMSEFQKNTKNSHFTGLKVVGLENPSSQNSHGTYIEYKESMLIALC
ncbi:hypothetical protein AMTRI_Chr08g204340 [Amborella trichopoda]